MEEEKPEVNKDEENTENAEETTRSGMSENEIVVMILVITAVLLIIIGVYVWINRKYYGFAEAKCV